MPLLTPHVPSGLIDLMKDLAKEVLRDKPENIYEFAVIHFEKLILERDGSLDKGYEEFSAFDEYFDGQQRFAVPSNCGYICQRPIKIQPIPQPRKSKSDIMASFQAMESINEEDVLAQAPAPEAASLYTDEKYQNAIYVIQRYFRRYMARNKNQPNTNKAKSLSAFTAAIIIQRTMRRLFSNKIKLKMEKDSGPSVANAVKLVQDDMDNVSEAASYTSSSTIQMLADGQEGRENRLASAQSRRQREEVLDDYGDVDGGGSGGSGGVDVGAADLSSMEFKEPTQDEEPQLLSSSATAVVVDDDEEHSHSVVAVTETDRKSITDENGNGVPIPEEKPHLKSASTTDDTSTAHNIGILSTKIGSNYNHQNLTNTNNHIEIDRNRRDPIQINANQLNIVPDGLSVPLKNPQSLLGANPDTLPATSPNLKETQETFQVHHLEEYANENGKNNDASTLYQVDGRIRKFDSDIGESLKIYDVYNQDMNDQEFSDSLNESIMEKDSLEPEELDADSLESNENVVHHMSDIVKRDTRQDDGSLYGDKNDDEEGDRDEESNDNAQNVQKFIEIERVPTYLYGIHPARTPVFERRNKNRNSEESHKVPDDKKYLEAGASSEVDSRSPDDKSEEESLESKGSTSEESSVTQIENKLELRAIQDKTSGLKVQPGEDAEEQTKYSGTMDKLSDDGNSKSLIAHGQLIDEQIANKLELRAIQDKTCGLKVQPGEDAKELTKYSGTMDKLFDDEHSKSLIAHRQLIDENETNHPTPQIENFTLNNDSKTKGDSKEGMSSSLILKDNASQVSTEKPTHSGEDSINRNDTSLSGNETEHDTSKKQEPKQEEEHHLSPSKLKEEITNLETGSKILKKINSGLDENLRSNDLEKPNLKENTLLVPGKTASEKLIDSEREVSTESIVTTSKREATSFQKENDNLNSISDEMSSLARKVETPQTEQSQRDVKNSEDKLQKTPSKNEESKTSSVYDGKMIEPLDYSKELVYGEDIIKQEPKVSANTEINKNKIDASVVNREEEQINIESSSNLSKTEFEEISKMSESPKDDQNLKSEIGECGQKDVLGHNKEIESQLQELQNLNDLLPGLNAKDITPVKSQLGNKRSEDRRNHKISQHDDNNNLENVHPNELNTSGKSHDSEKSTIEELEKQPQVSADKNTLMKVEKILASSKVVADEILTLNDPVMSTISELSGETNGTITEVEIKIPQEDFLAKESEESQSILVEGNSYSSENFEQNLAQKTTLSDRKREDLLKKTKEAVSNEEEKIILNGSGTDSIKNTSIDDHISKNSAKLNILPSTSGKVMELITYEESEDNSKNNRKEENCFILDHTKSEAVTEFLSAPVGITSCEKSKTIISNDNHDFPLEGGSTKEKVLTENKIDIEDKLDNEDNQDASRKLLDKDKNALLENKIVEEVKQKIRAERSGSNDGCEEKEETIDSKQVHTSEKSTGSHDSHNSDKTINSSNECSAEKKKIEDINAFDTKKEAANITLKTEKSQNMVFPESSKITEQKASEKIELEDLKEANLDNDSQNTNSSGNLKAKRFDEEKLHEEVVSKQNHIVEAKKLTNKELSNNTNFDQESKAINENEKTIQDSRNPNGSEEQIDIVSENPLQGGVDSNENISAKISPSKKADIEDSIQTASTNIEGFDSSAETSADFSSIGKDLEFFEDTIKYLKNATEHLGGMEDIFDARKKSSDDISKDADVLNHSAVLIQSAFRGYQIRKDLVNKSQNKSEADIIRNKRSLDKNKTNSDSKDENKVKAAIKIQSAYRGHRVRKDLRDKSKREEIESLGNVPSSSNEDKNYIQSPSKNILGSNSVKSQIPVAVIHPTNYLSSMEECPHPEKASESRPTNSKSISSFERNEIAASSPSKQIKSGQTNLVNAKNLKVSPKKTTILTRQKPLEKKPNVKNDISDEFKEEPSISHKKSVEKNDHTFIRDLDQTVKMDQTQVIGNRKLTKTNNSGGHGNKSKNFHTKTLSTADLLERPKGSKNVRDQFQRKGKSVSINGRAQNQESFDLETIKKDLLSTTFKSPPQSGRKKRTKSGKQRSPVKQFKGTKIPQKSPSKTTNSKQTKRAEVPSGVSSELEKPVSINEKSNEQESDLSKTFTLETDQDKNLVLSLESDKKEINNNAKKPTTLSKTKTIRSSLNEVENLDSLVKTSEKKVEHSSEDLFDSLKKDMDKLKASVQEKSAVTIQKTFRGFRTRKNLNRGFKSSTASVAPESPISVPSKNVVKSSSENQLTTTEGISKDIKKVKVDITVQETKKGSLMSIEELHDPDLDKAATKIQKNYRGYKTRKNYKTLDEKGSKVKQNQDTMQEITQNLGGEPKAQQSNELNNEESKNYNLEKSALTIQKTYRGYRSRRESQEISKVQKNKGKDKDPNSIKDDVRSNTQTDNLNLDSKYNARESGKTSGILEDVQKDFEGYKNLVLDKSATTIQKHFRGYRTRKDMKKKGVRSGIAKDPDVHDTKVQGDKEQNEAKQKSVVHEYVVKKSDIRMEGGKQETGEDFNKSALQVETGPLHTQNKLKEKAKTDLDLEKSATTIQKHFRGYKTRKNMNKKGVRSGKAKDTDVLDMKAVGTEEQNEGKQKHVTEKSDIKVGEGKQETGDDFNKSALQEETGPLHNQSKLKEKPKTDHDLEKSATTIQKHFRGYKIRKNMNKKGVKSGKAKDTDVLDMKAVGTEEQNEGKQKHVTEKSDIKVGEGKQETGDDFNKSALQEETGPLHNQSKLKEKPKTDHDLEKSATTIQKHFRGYKTRKDISKGVRSGKVKDTPVYDMKVQGNEEQIEAKEKSPIQPDVIRKNDTKEKGGKQETRKSGIDDFNKSDRGLILIEAELKEKTNTVHQSRSTDLEKSATTIQKNFRGYRTRKNLNRDTMVTDSELEQKIISEKADNGKIDDKPEKSNNEDIKKLSVFDSFDVEEFHNEALQKSATTIQKTFRGYKTRKELLSKKVPTKPSKDIPENYETKQKIVHPVYNDQAINLNKESFKATGIRQNEVKLNLEKSAKTGNLDLPQQLIEDSSLTNVDALSEDVLKNIHSKTNNPKESKKSSSAGAVLENAASTIQKAYRDYQAKKNNHSTKSYSNGNHRETAPKEVMENSDESSTFIGPDTSFDLSDVESVETKSEKAFLNYDKINSSEAHTPTNNSDEGPASTLSINGVHSEGRETDNECVNSPEKLRLKRSIIEPTAPSLDEILRAEEAKSASPKPKWFLGDDPIIPSNSIYSSKSSSPASSSSVDPLITISSKFNDLSSIDACRENLNSNQQLTPSISSAVVSTSSLLLNNNTEINDKNTLNKNSGIVSANEEENLKKAEINMEKSDQSEDILKNLVNEDKTDTSVVKSNENLSKETESGDTDAKTVMKTEEKEDNNKEVATDLCKNCAEGIHQGGICSEDLIKTSKSEQTESDPSDQIKEFVLMEELNHAQIPSGKTESSVISSQKGETLSIVSSTESSNVTVTANGLNSQDSTNQISTEKLNSSNYRPSISLIPPSSEDDASERETSIKVRARHVNDELQSQKPDDGKSEDITKVKMEIKRDIESSLEKSKDKENVETKAEKEFLDTDDTVKKANIKSGENISAESVNVDLVVDSKEDKNTISEEETAAEMKTAHEEDATDTMQIFQDEARSSSKDDKSRNLSNEIEEKDSNISNLDEPLEDAFKMRLGDDFKTEKQGFEDDFSDNKDIEKASEENQISTELGEKRLPIKESVKLSTHVKNEESSETNKIEATRKFLENEKGKSFEENNVVLVENLSEAKGLECEKTTQEGSYDLMEEIEKSSDQIINEETAARNESLETKTDNQNTPLIELKALENAAQEDTKEEPAACDTMNSFDNVDKQIDLQQKEEIKKGEHQHHTQKDETEIKEVSKTLQDALPSTKDEDRMVKSEVSKENVKSTDAIETKTTTKDEKSFDAEKNEKKDQLQEDIEIAAKLIESSLSDPQAKLLENENKSKLPIKEMSSTDNKMTLDSNECSKMNEEAQHCEDKNEPDSQVEAKLEKMIEDNLKPAVNIKNTVDPKDLPTENSSQEIVEEPCVKKVIPPTPYSAISDPDESEMESTTTKAESTTTTLGYDETSETDALDIPPSKPDILDAMAEKLREPEEMVARMRQRRASEHKISIDSVTDQPQAVFEEPICEPIKPMQMIQKSSSTEAEDEFVLQKLQRGDTTRESSAQSESVIYGDSTSQLTESEDTFNENLDLNSLHRMNTIAANRSTFKPQNHLFKSVTIDDTVKYIDPEKSTEESGSSFCLDDALSEDVRKKMMAYSISEADSDYFDVGDQTNYPHDDFNISTALDNFPSTDTDTTIVSAATKIQAGARGFLTRRRIRRASMGTKTSLTEERNLSFGNDAIGESLDQLAEEEAGRRQFNRQIGVNSLPSALEHSDEMLSPLGDDIQIATVPSAEHSLIKIKKIEGEKSNKVTTLSENDVNDDWLKKSEDDSSQIVSNLEATVARRLTLQRGDAMRNDSTPDDENGNGKQVDLAKNNLSSMGAVLVHEKTMVESTTTTTTRTTTERRNYSDAAVSNKKEKIKWFALRQNSMPVQIDSEVFRVLPKHMRKRIKSAEGEKPKRIRLPRD